MSEVELKKLFQIEDILSLPNAIFKIIFDNDERLHHIYRELLQLNTHDLSRDWFQDIYEGELAQRNQNKQDFTPNVVGILLSRLTGVLPSSEALMTLDTSTLMRFSGIGLPWTSMAVADTVR